MKTTRTIIIDDERLAREELRSLLKEYQEIEIVAEAINGIDGIEKIKEFNPDLIFLDVSMPGMNGFEMLKQLEDLPQVVFVTAHDEFALQAVENQALDYILKPIDPEKIANRRVFEQEAVSNVLDALNKMKGVQSDKDMEYIKRTAVSLSDDPATIKAWFKKTQSLIDRGKQGKQFIDEAVSKGMSREEAEKSYHDWAINNPLVYKGAEKTQNVKSHHNKTPLTPAEARMALQMGAGQ
jgi:YesN/AraC family two-component response regulator